MSSIYYRIIATKGEQKDKFSNGGANPTFKKVGKIWAQRNHVMAHLSQLSSNSRAGYRQVGAVIEEFIPDFQETMDITEFLDMTDRGSIQTSLRDFFTYGSVSSSFFLGVVSENQVLVDNAKLFWNRTKLVVDHDQFEKTLPVHCYGAEVVDDWIAHNGYSNAPDEVKAMLMLEHEGSRDIVDQWIKAYDRQLK